MASTKGLDFGWATARFMTGLVMTYYGSQKALGLFGGNGFAATVEGFQQGLGIPPVFAVLAILAEFLGGIGLALGLLTRPAAFGVFSTMMVAMMVNITKQGGLGILANGTPETVTSIFYTLILGMVALGAVLGGGGKYSLDHSFNLESKIPFLRPNHTSESPADPQV